MNPCPPPSPLTSRVMCLLALWLLIGGMFASPGHAQPHRAASNHSDVTIKGPMAFIGDSLSTGAVSHPALGLDRLELLDILSGKSSAKLSLPADLAALQAELGLKPINFDRYPHPRRLGPSTASFSGPLYWVYRNFSHAIAVNYLDFEQLSWAYALAQQWGVSGDDVIIAANDGARAEAAFAQVRLLADLPPAQFPRTVFMLFTGNDLCGASSEAFTAAGAYGGSLTRALNLLNRIAEEKGLNKIVVVLLEPINIMQLVVNPTIQQKAVRFGDRSFRCSEIQQPGFKAPRKPEALAGRRDEDRMLLSFNLLPESPSRYCSGIFQPTAAGETNRAAASAHWSDYRQQIQKVAKDAWQFDQLQVISLDAPAKFLLTGEDIARDCFHLSYRGQFRLAADVAKALRKVVPHHE